jgi:hypothetical protein
MKKLLLASIALASFSHEAIARPTGFADSYMVMTENDGGQNSASVMYSPEYNYAVGYTADYWREKEYQAHSLLLNYLAKRWNNPESQANIYVKSNWGAAVDSGNTEPFATVGLEADWEDRRFFTLYENRYVYAGNLEKGFMQKARIGIAPYEGDYGDLHTWLMLQVDHKPEDKDEITVTPLVRLFQGPVLGEFGVSNQGKVLFNLTYQFKD